LVALADRVCAGGRVEIVSEMFEGKTLVQRHRLVYQALSEELEAGLHALALKTKTPAEADKSL
jgi:stress-induced morphogen